MFEDSFDWLSGAESTINDYLPGDMTVDSLFQNMVEGAKQGVLTNIAQNQQVQQAGITAARTQAGNSIGKMIVDNWKIIALIVLIIAFILVRKYRK